MGLLLVILGGVVLQALRLPRRPDGASITPLTTASRSFVYLVVVCGALAVLASTAIYQAPELSIWSTTGVDGLLLLVRFGGLIAVVFGGLLVWGGRLLQRPAAAPASLDVYLGRVVCGVGYCFMVAGVVVVAIIATKLGFSGYLSIPQLEREITRSGSRAMFLIETLFW
jgi:hypothetical protein